MRTQDSGCRSRKEAENKPSTAKSIGQLPDLYGVCSKPGCQSLPIRAEGYTKGLGNVVVSRVTLQVARQRKSRPLTLPFPGLKRSALWSPCHAENLYST